jgi:hypothetical protein
MQTTKVLLYPHLNHLILIHHLNHLILKERQ